MITAVKTLNRSRLHMKKAPKRIDKTGKSIDSLSTYVLSSLGLSKKEGSDEHKRRREPTGAIRGSSLPSLDRQPWRITD